MALHFELMVNGGSINRTVVIQRMPHALGEGPVYRYEAWVVDGQGHEGRRVPFTHDYDDGALWCARRALDALLGGEVPW